MNLQPYITRYLPLFEAAVTSLPDPTHFSSGLNQPYTHVVRLRQVRKHLAEHPSSLPIHLRTPDFLDRLNSLNFWYVDDIVYLGHKSNFGLDSHILTHSASHTPSYNTISRPLTPDELQALFYCYNSSLFSIPTRLENQPDSIKQLINTFAPACPNVGISYSDTFITLL